MEMGKILGIIIAATLCMIFIGYLMAPVITELTGEGGALADYSALVGVIPIVAIVAIVVMVVAPVLGKRGL